VYHGRERDAALNRESLPRRAGHPNVEGLEGQPLFGMVERLQALPHPCTVIDERAHLRDGLPDGVQPGLAGGLLCEQTLAVRDFEIQDLLSNVVGKAVLFLDTCHSGQLLLGKGAIDALPDITKFANELADSDAGIVVFASSTGREISKELDQFQHGAFTYALLEGIRGKADYTEDSVIMISELETYLAERVKALTEGKQKPVTAKPKAVENYPLIRVQRGS
jgi:hypothetical protein